MERDIARRKYDVLCIGVALLDNIVQGFDPNPISVSGYRAESSTLNVGGEAVNESITLAKLGVNVGILCFLGEDQAGMIVQSELKNHSVGTDMIQWKKEHTTPVTTMLVRKDGSRHSINNPAHMYNFHPETVDIIPHVSMAVLLGSLFRAPFDDPKIIRSVAAAAKSQGLLTIADTKLPNFRTLTLKEISDALPLIDYITPNEDEARYYTGKEDPEEMAKAFLDHGVRNVIIKLGRKGCYFRNAEEAFLVPGLEVPAVVDTTGAGDNFIAGFVSEILQGTPIRQALVFANACGAICSTAAGACSALKDREQILTFLRDHQRG